MTVGGNNGREGTEREVEWLTATAPSIHHRGSEEDGLWVREGQGGGGWGAVGWARVTLHGWWIIVALQSDRRQRKAVAVPRACGSAV